MLPFRFRGYLGAGITTAAIALYLGIPIAIAQEGNGCFVKTPDGRTINLDRLCGPSTPSSSNRANQSVFQAPIKYRLGKTPVIDVMFNGNQTFEMIVDTGADGTLITRQMADALRVPVVGSARFIMADGRVVGMPVGRLESMSVDGAEVRNIRVAISNQSTVGLLGHDFFANYDVKIRQTVVEFHRR